MHQLTIPSLQELVQPYQHLPKVIQQAIFLADTHPSLSRVLTRGYRSVLRSLVTLVNKANGTDEFRVIPHLLAAKADVSEKTVQRALATMKKLGLIAQIGDGRDDTGAFTRHAYQLTEYLANLLRLPVKSCSRRKTKMSGDLILELSLKNDQEILEKRADSKGIVLPAELAQTGAELAIKDTGMAKLRGEAHRAGYDLAHIVACAKARLKATGATGGRAFRYLQAMIARTNADYAGRAAQERRSAAETERLALARAAMDKCAGKRFVGPDGLTYRFLSGGTAEILDGGLIMGTAAGQQVTDLLVMVASGELTELVGSPIPAPTSATSAPTSTARDSLAGILKMLKKNNL